MAKSRVGVRMIVFGFFEPNVLANLSLSITGKQKARVLPEPVRSRPIKSFFL